MTTPGLRRTPPGTAPLRRRPTWASRKSRSGRVTPSGIPRTDQLTPQWTKNLHRADLPPVQEARAYCTLLDAGAPQASIARAVGVPASRVRERLALLDIDQDVQEMVHRGELPMRVALQLAP